MDNVINFQDIKNKKIKLLSPPKSSLDKFIDFRRDLTRQLDLIFVTLCEFEDKELVYSNVKPITRPMLDQYISNKMAFLLSHELLKRIDTQVKTQFPSMIFPSVDTYSF